MVRSLFRNSSRKLRSLSWGSLFILVCTNQTEMLLTIYQLLGSCLVPDSCCKNSRLFGFKPYWMWQFCGKLVNRLPLWFWHPNRIFLSKGKHPRYSTLPTGRNEILKINFSLVGALSVRLGGEPQKVSFINRVKKVNLLPYIDSTADVLSVHLKCRP